MDSFPPELGEMLPINKKRKTITMKRSYSIKIITLFCAIFCNSCFKMDTDSAGTVIETPDWTEATHGSASSPNYTTVFAQNTVQRLDIVISATNWAAIQKNLASLSGGRPGANLDEGDTPIWVPCDYQYNGKQWYKVGIRAKGNSSLRTTYSSGNKKYSFKLDFDQYEDTYPAISNQRFYGFKQLNLNNNSDDLSLMREKVAGELFREFVIPCAKSAFYEVYINFGNGSQFFGLYTMVEEVDNTVITTQFSDGSGNLYKPEGTAASFANGSFNTTSMYKKTNLELNDYSDITALYDAVNSSLRTSDPTAWRTLMESKIDMTMFLKWLAANTVMQNWDTYGKMSHNYYLYNHPTIGKFVWVPWDNNESLQSGKMGGAINIDLSGVSSQWPFIDYIASDNKYFPLYKQYAKEFASTVFTPAKMYATYTNYASLLRPYAAKEVSGYTFLKTGISGFDAAISQLKSHVDQRSASAIALK